jgi:hypothetical protein
MPQLQTAGDVRAEAAPAVGDRVVDRLEGGEAVAHLGHMRPGLGGVVVDAGKDPDPAVDSGLGHGGVGVPALVERIDRELGQQESPGLDPAGGLLPDAVDV